MDTQEQPNGWLQVLPLRPAGCVGFLAGYECYVSGCKMGGVKNARNFMAPGGVRHAREIRPFCCSRFFMPDSYHFQISFHTRGRIW